MSEYCNFICSEGVSPKSNGFLCKESLNHSQSQRSLSKRSLYFAPVGTQSFFGSWTKGEFVREKTPIISIIGVATCKEALISYQKKTMEGHSFEDACSMSAFVGENDKLKKYLCLEMDFLRIPKYLLVILGIDRKPIKFIDIFEAIHKKGTAVVDSTDPIDRMASNIFLTQTIKCASLTENRTSQSPAQLLCRVKNRKGNAHSRCIRHVFKSEFENCKENTKMITVLFGNYGGVYSLLKAFQLDKLIEDNSALVLCVPHPSTYEINCRIRTLETLNQEYNSNSNNYCLGKKSLKKLNNFNAMMFSRFLIEKKLSQLR